MRWAKSWQTLLLLDHLGGPSVHVGRERGVLVVPVNVFTDRHGIAPDIAKASGEGVDRLAPDIGAKGDEFRRVKEVEVVLLYGGSIQGIRSGFRDGAS